MDTVTDRSNDQWTSDLRAEGPTRSAAISDLRARLTRGLFYYLSTERSDLSDLSSDELQHMAEDFAQDAILKVLENLGSFRGESQFTTWASKIATRIAISELRRARYRDYSLDHLTTQNENLPTFNALPGAGSESTSPERDTERAEIMAMIQRGLDQVLTEKQRIALTAYTIDGVPIEELAHRLDTNRNALYKLVHDARVKLKRYLESQGLGVEYMVGLFAE